MKPDRLQSELIALPYNARFRRLQEIGREAKTDLKIVAILDAWESGDWQQRLWCVQACAGSGDVDRLQRMHGDASRTVSGLASDLPADHVLGTLRVWPYPQKLKNNCQR